MPQYHQNSFESTNIDQKRRKNISKKQPQTQETRKEDQLNLK